MSRVQIERVQKVVDGLNWRRGIWLKSAREMPHIKEVCEGRAKELLEAIDEIRHEFGVELDELEKEAASV